MPDRFEALWKDPLAKAGQDKPGVLLSDQIQHYVEQVDMIRPFARKLLRPAAYTLTVGDRFWQDDRESVLRKGSEIVIPPNGLVYIRTAEVLTLPYYLVARYSMRVKLVYAGLVLDNGLQVDPGYVGRLHIPVYNLCDTKRTLAYGYPFLSIEFARTTPFQPQFRGAAPRDREELILSSAGWSTDELAKIDLDTIRTIRSTLAQLDGHAESSSQDARAALVDEIGNLKRRKSLYRDNAKFFEEALRSGSDAARLCRKHPGLRDSPGDGEITFNVIELNCLLMQALVPHLPPVAHRLQNQANEDVVLFHQHPDDVPERAFTGYLRQQDDGHRSSLEKIVRDLKRETRKNRWFRGIGWGAIFLGSITIVVTLLSMMSTTSDVASQNTSWASTFRSVEGDSRSALRQAERLDAKVGERLRRYDDVLRDIESRLQQDKSATQSDIDEVRRGLAELRRMIEAMGSSGQARPGQAVPAGGGQPAGQGP